MVTKQEQLEWLAKECDVWPVNGEYFTMNRYAVGACVHAHVITRQEWQQERDKMRKKSSQTAQDNSWYERGELPPVGCECWCCLDDKPVFIVAHHHFINAVVYSSALGGGELCYGYAGGFRPLRTEREKAIDEMMSGYQSAKGDKPVHPRCRFFAEYLYDAGYRKQ